MNIKLSYTCHHVAIHSVSMVYINCFCLLSSFSPSQSITQQQMHAQQIPITPPHPIPTLAGPLGAFAGPMGLPHGPQALLKVPQELHRDDINKPLGGPSAEERLVSVEVQPSLLFASLSLVNQIEAKF